MREGNKHVCRRERPPFPLWVFQILHRGEKGVTDFDPKVSDQESPSLFGQNGAPP